MRDLKEFIQVHAAGTCQSQDEKPDIWDMKCRVFAVLERERAPLREAMLPSPTVKYRS